MSSRGIQTHHADDSKSCESLPPSQSMWMSHWMQTDCKSPFLVQSHSSLHDCSKQKDRDSNQEPMVGQIAESSKQTRLSINVASCNVSEYKNSRRRQHRGTVVASSVPQSAKNVLVTEAKRVEITNESLVMNSKNLRNARAELKPYAIFSNKIESLLVPKKGLAVPDVHALKDQTNDSYAHDTTNSMESNDPYFPFKMLRSTLETELPSRQHVFHPEGRSQSQEKFVEPCRSLAKKISPVPRLFPDKLTGSTVDSVPLGFKSREFQSFISRMEEIDQSSSQVASERHLRSTDFTLLEHENYNCHEKISFSVCDKKIDNELASGKSASSGQKDKTIQVCDSSTSNFCFPIVQGNMIHGLNNTRTPPSNSCPVGISKLEEMGHGCHSSPEILFSVHDAEKLRVSTADKSVVGIPGGPPKFSQLTHLLSNKTSKGDDTFREATSSTNFNGSASPKLLTLLSDFNCRDKSGVKHGERNVGDVNTRFLRSKNESSADTETMDVNFCQTRKSLSKPPYTSNKGTVMNQYTALLSTISLWRERFGSRVTETESFDTDREPSTSATGKKDLSPSKTESLDLKHRFEDDQAGNSSFSPQQYRSQGPASSSRGVKRQKPYSFDSHANGTKFIKLEESSPREQANKLYRGQMELDTTMPMLGNKESSSMLSAKERSWIQRWCHKPVKTATLVAYEPEITKMELEEFQRKQFPSLGAMALLGKAMKVFQACKFQNRGSFVVWNAG